MWSELAEMTRDNREKMVLDQIIQHHWAVPENSGGAFAFFKDLFCLYRHNFCPTSFLNKIVEPKSSDMAAIQVKGRENRSGSILLFLLLLIVTSAFLASYNTALHNKQLRRATKPSRAAWQIKRPVNLHRVQQQPVVPIVYLRQV
jgi:hypothetical protein